MLFSKRKLYLLSAVALGAVATVGFAISCGNDQQTNNDKEPGDGTTDPTPQADPAASAIDQGLERRQIYKQAYNGTHTVKPFNYDSSASYGGETAGAESWYSSIRWFRYRRSGQSKVKKESTLDGTTRYTVVSPTHEWVQLELAGEIVLTLWDGTVKHYTNSKHEVTPEWDKKSNVLRLSSADPKSVNNPQFRTDLENAQKMQILTRKGVKWTNANNESTKYNLKTEDFFYSWQRTQLYDFVERMANGGVIATTKAQKEGESDVNVDKVGTELEKVYGTSDIGLFNPENRYPNGYLFELNGIDLAAISDESKTVVDVVDDSGETVKGFTFYADKGLIETNASKAADAPYQLAGFVNQFQSLLNDLTFVPAPSEYIAEFANTPESKLSKTVAGLSSVSGEAKKYGYYWYGAEREHTLFVGPYVPAGYDATTFKETHNVNKGFHDQEWVKNPMKINQIVSEYKSAPVDASLYQTQSFNSYNEGQSDVLSYSGLSKEQKNTIDAGKGGKYVAVNYTRPKNTSKVLYNLLRNFNPSTKIAVEGGYFNDAYSQIVYGKTKTELRAAGTSTVAAASLGDARIFRTLYQGVLNPYAFASAVSNGQSMPLISGAAVDGVFTSKATTTVRDKLHEVNAVTIFNADGTKMQFSDGSTLLSYDLLKTFVDKTDETERLQSPAYEQIKAQMKLFLDAMYTKYNIASDQKVKWERVHRYLNASDNEKSAIKVFVKLVNSLDPRLDFSFKYATEGSELLAAITNNVGTENFGGWGYDYDGIGSYYTALASNQTLLYTASALLTATPAVQAQYPELLNLATWFKNTLQTDATKPNYIPVSFDKLKFISNDILNAGNELTELAFDEATNTFRVLDPKTPADKAILDQRANVTQWTSLFAKLLLQYQETRTVEQHVAAMQEMTSIFSWEINNRLLVSESFSTYVQNPKFITPSGESNIPYMQDTSLAPFEQGK